MANLSNINNKFLVTTGGDVGIGVTSPQMGLHVADGLGALFGPTVGSTSYFSPTNANTLNGGWNRDDDVADIWLNFRGYQDGFTRFRNTRIGDGKGGLMAIFNGSTGNVGIGTDSPSFQLSIENHATTSSIATFEIDGKRTNGTDGAVGEMIFSNNGDTFATVAGFRDGADNKGSLQFQTQDSTFATRMTISSEGNVGIGVTPNNTQAITTQITNGLSLFGNNSTPYGFISNNHAWTSPGGDQYLVNGYGASYYKQYDGVHSWATAPSGNAGSTATFTETMRIDSSGNVAISGYGIQIDRPDVAGGKPYIFWKSGGTTQASIYGASSGGGLRIFLNGGGAAFDNSISFTGIVQQNAQSVVLSNSAYANAAAVQAYASNTANVYPGYGFHKASVLGGFLYATSRTELRYRGDGGTDKVLLMADSDYEEGTWTPVVIASNGGTASGSAWSGAVYTKVGRMVNVVAYNPNINITTITSGNYIQLTGLPFTATAYGDFTAAYKGGGWTGGNIIGGYVQAGQSYAYFMRADGTEATRVNGSTINKFMVNITYQTI